MHAVPSLLRHPAVRFASLTGSVAKDVADLRAAAASLVDGATNSAGQSFGAVERVYMHRKVYLCFLELAAEDMRAGAGDGRPEG